MQDRSLKYLTYSLDAAKALGIAAQNVPPVFKATCLDGLHSALICAEEARQQMQEASSHDMKEGQDHG